MTSHQFPLERFVDVQAHTFEIAMQELRSGKKRSHWIWYVFPQLKGLGHSATSHNFGLANLVEARAFLAHPILGQRLKEATNSMLAHRSRKVDDVLGELDALKFRSCLTLFALADPSEKMFTDALECFFGGARDPRTIKLLKDNEALT